MGAFGQGLGPATRIGVSAASKGAGMRTTQALNPVTGGECSCP